jgi:microcystin-dependent protein
LHCAGQAVSRSTYATLFAVIGTTYGVGDNVSTFNVPDCIGRMTICQDYGFGRSNLLGNTLGTVGGSQWLHAHNHTGGDSGHVHGVTDGVGGGGHAHSMVEPLGGHGHVGRDTGHAHTSVSAPPRATGSARRPASGRTTS